MNGFLGRIATRGASGGGTASTRSLVRSRSPIAELDQRVGMPGFERVGVVGVGQDRGPVAEGESPTAGGTSSLPTVPSVSGAASARGARTSAAIRAEGTPRVRNRYQEVTVATPSSPASPDSVDPNALAPSVQVNDVREALIPPPAAAPTVEVLAPTGGPRSSRPGPEVWPPGTPSEAPVRAPRRGLESLVETTPVHRIPIDPPDAPVARPDDEPSPELTIIREIHHHQHTEERPEEEATRRRKVQPTTAPARPQPATAATVSHIGPLATGRRSNLRFAMRQR